MGKITKKTVIDKATVDKPVWDPIDPDQRAVLILCHTPTGWVLKTRGWTLNEVLTIMGWKSEHVWATFRRTWTKDRGAVWMSSVTGIQDGLEKLNTY
jgi:hypothetical protein